MAPGDGFSQASERRAARAGRATRREEATRAGKGSRDVSLRVADLDADLLDPRQHLGPQVPRDVVVAAMLVDEPFHRLLETVLAQARTALVEMLLYLGTPGTVELA